jgi:transposase
LAQGWTASAVSDALEREPHTIGVWVAAFSDNGPTALAFEQSGGSPRPRRGQQAQVKAAVQVQPEKAGIDLANWNWKVVRRFVQERFGLLLSRSSCLNYLHQLGFVLKRPKKHFLKAGDAKREAFVAAYAALLIEAQQVGAKIFFADEAHFRADADLRGKWVLKGESALVDSTSPRWGEKASYYSAVCLETGEVGIMELQVYSNAETSTAFLKQLRDKHTGPLNVIWDNAPAHHGDALRTYLATPGLRLGLVSLPGYSPDFNATEANWDWAREEVTANLYLGTKAAVQEKLGHFFAQSAYRREEVRHRCQTVLQARAEKLFRGAHPSCYPTIHVDPTLDLV